MSGGAPAQRRPGIATLLWRGLRRRCPQCGGGRLFSTWFRMVPVCPTCGYRFEREEGFFLGAFVVNLAVSEGLLAVVLAVAFVTTLPDPPVTLIAAAAALSTVLAPLAFYPFSKTIWAAVDMAMFRGEPHKPARR